jgi:hypothetical protein
MEALDQFRNWQESGLLVRVSYVDWGTSLPRAGFKVLGTLRVIEASAVAFAWIDGEVLFNFEEATFRYAEPPADLIADGVEVLACVQADWTDGSRGLFLARRGILQS